MLRHGANLRTGDLARAAGVHPNTVRLYERLGYLTPVPRAANGYRVFGQRHLYQIKICRCIYSYGWVGKDLRKASLRVIRAMAQWDLPQATRFARQYLELIMREYEVAEETANILARWVTGEEEPPAPPSGPTVRDTDLLPVEAGTGEVVTYSRRQAAKVIGVTPETLRNWERNGLIDVPRVGLNRDRVYGAKEIERLRVIYMLRQSRYSLSAILSSLRQYDTGNHAGAVPALHRPEEPEGISWLLAGDRWLEALSDTAAGGRKILLLIEEAKSEQI